MDYFSAGLRKMRERTSSLARSLIKTWRGAGRVGAGQGVDQAERQQADAEEDHGHGDRDPAQESGQQRGGQGGQSDRGVDQPDAVDQEKHVAHPFMPRESPRPLIGFVGAFGVAGRGILRE